MESHPVTSTYSNTQLNNLSSDRNSYFLVCYIICGHVSAPAIPFCVSLYFLVFCRIVQCNFNINQEIRYCAIRRFGTDETEKLHKQKFRCKIKTETGVSRPNTSSFLSGRGFARKFSVHICESMTSLNIRCKR